jgi:soluble lytic murein transglycosylase-like protein
VIFLAVGFAGGLGMVMGMNFKTLLLCAASACVLIGAICISGDDEGEGAYVADLGIAQQGSRAHLSSSQVACVGNLEGELVHTAIESKLDPKLLLAVIHVESGCNASARSSRGAVGLMQILPSTAKAVGVDDATTVKGNIQAGARYLRTLQDQFKSDIRLSLAAYNAGPAAVKKYGGIPPFRETQQYVRAILKVYGELNKNMI